MGRRFYHCIVSLYLGYYDEDICIYIILKWSASVGVLPIWMKAYDSDGDSMLEKHGEDA